MKDIYIQSTSFFLSDYNIPQSEIKAEIKKISGKSFRRINRYILIGLAGLFKLRNIADTKSSTSLYIGTKKGCVEDTTDILYQIYKEKMLPMPFAFIAASANMANYHIANALGLQAGSYTISHKYQPFEAVLKMALNDLFESRSNASIVGHIDENMETNNGLKNGSSWITLTTNPQESIGKIRSYQEYSSLNELLKTNLLGMAVMVNSNLPTDERETIFSFADHCIVYANTFEVFPALESRQYKTIAFIFRLSRKKISLCIIDSSR